MENQLSNHFITALASDGHDQIWIGTMGGGVNIFNRKTFRITSGKTNSPADFVSSIVVANKKVWIGSRAGLKIFSTETGKLDSFLPGNRSPIAKEVTTIIKGLNDNVCVGFADGEIGEVSLSKNNVSLKQYTHLNKITGRASFVHAMSSDSHGNLWIVTEKSGLGFFNFKTKELSQFLPEEGNPQSLPAYSLRTVYCDNNERVWVGTYNRGVHFTDARTKKFELYQRNAFAAESLHDDNVRAFAEDKEGNIWIATNAGINKMNIRTRRISRPAAIQKQIGRKVVKDLMVDSKNNLWIGTRDEGIIKINPETAAFQRFNVVSTGRGNNQILCIYEDKRKTIWAGTLGSGLFYFDDRANTFVSLNEKSKQDYLTDSHFVTSIMEDSDSTLWVGTLHGLFTLRRENKNAFSYKAYYQHKLPSNLSSSRITTLYQDQSKNIWVGTFDNGLNKFDKAREVFENYTEDNGLINNSIKGVIGDAQGTLWISTNAGISRFDPVQQLSKNYAKEDGLNSNTFNQNSCLHVSTGHFIFGGDNGFNIFHPDSISDDRRPPVVYLTNLRINNKNVTAGMPGSPLEKNIEVTDHLELSYDKRSFAIDFVALSYGPSSKNHYCYMLEGFENTWNCVGNNLTATYTNIDPGDYTFLVKGANSDGTWSEVPAELHIVVHPPVWNTWWARILYLSSFLALTYLFLKIRLERIHMKSELRMEKREREREHELSESKMQFFTNVSHELRTPLSLIFMPLEKMVTSDIPGNIKSGLTTAYQNCAKLMNLVNELMDLSKFEEVKPTLCAQHGELIRFITEIASTFQDVAERKKIRMVLNPTVPEISGWYDADKLEKILRNLLSNAFKFTPEQGEINLRIEIIESAVKQRTISITVADNGIGISQEDLPKIFDKFYQAKQVNNVSHTGTGIGLSLTKTLIDVYHGIIDVQSTLGQGTIFNIQLPIEKAAFAENEIAKNTSKTDNASVNSAAEYENIILDQSLGKPELLIIEDNDELREFLAAELSLDFSVTTAADGEKGFTLACDSVPDLIISDIVLPHKNGLTLCQEIKSDLRTSHIPIVLLTAKGSPDDQVVGFERGADVYIPKPFSLRVLKAHFKQIVTERKKLYARYSQDVYLAADNLSESSVDKEFLRKLVGHIDENLLNSQLSVESIASFFNVSRSQVYRKIKALTGQTVVEFIRTVRLKHALTLMEERKYNLSEIADRTGFNSLSYFTRSFKDQYGKAPSEYVNGIKK